jgi:hypothetical protein
MTLKISGELNNITTLDLELVHEFRRPYDKSGLEFDKKSSLSNSKPLKGLTLKRRNLKIFLLKMSNLEWIRMVDQTIMSTNIIMLIRLRLLIGQKVITRSTIRVQMVGPIRLRTKKKFSKMIN